MARTVDAASGQSKQTTAANEPAYNSQSLAFNDQSKLSSSDDVSRELDSSPVPPVNVQSRAVTSTEPVSSAAVVELAEPSTGKIPGENGFCDRTVVSWNKGLHTSDAFKCEVVTAVDSTTVDGDDICVTGARGSKIGPMTPPDDPHERIPALRGEKEDGEISDDEIDNRFADSNLHSSEISSTNNFGVNSQSGRREHPLVGSKHSGLDHRSRINVRGRSSTLKNTVDFSPAKWTGLDTIPVKNELKLEDESPLIPPNEWDHIGSPISSSDCDAGGKPGLSTEASRKFKFSSDLGNARSRSRSLSSEVDSPISSSESFCKEDLFHHGDELSAPGGKRKVNVLSVHSN